MGTKEVNSNGDNVSSDMSNDKFQFTLQSSKTKSYDIEKMTGKTDKTESKEDKKEG